MGNRSFFFILAFLTAVGAAQAAETAGVFLNPQGQDPRVEMTSTQFPWSAIGRLYHTNANGTISWCTASLVGRYEVLTAAHCLIDASGNPISVTFQPEFHAGAAPASSDSELTITGTTQPNADKGSDWGIAKLKDPLGDKFGFFEVSTLNAGPFPFHVQFAGYSADFEGGATAGAVESCYIHAKNDDGSFNHDCSTDGGASGGPLFYLNPTSGKNLIVGINTRGVDTMQFSSWDDGIPNVAVMNTDLVQNVIQFRQKYDAKK